MVEAKNEQGAVELFYANNCKKFSTINAGAYVNGSIGNNTAGSILQVKQELIIKVFRSMLLELVLNLDLTENTSGSGSASSDGFGHTF